MGQLLHTAATAPAAVRGGTLQAAAACATSTLGIMAWAWHGMLPRAVTAPTASPFPLQPPPTITHHTLFPPPRPQVVKGQKMMEGAGVRICRTLGTGALRNLDPFLMLDELKMPAHQAAAGFPDHPVSGLPALSCGWTGGGLPCVVVAGRWVALRWTVGGPLVGFVESCGSGCRLRPPTHSSAH